MLYCEKNQDFNLFVTSYKIVSVFLLMKFNCVFVTFGILSRDRGVFKLLRVNISMLRKLRRNVGTLPNFSNLFTKEIDLY